MIKVLHSSVWIALVTSAASFAAPPAPQPQPVAAPVTASPPLPGAPESLERRIALAQRFVALTVPAETYLDSIRYGVVAASMQQLEAGPTDSVMEQVKVEADLMVAHIEPQVRKSYALVAEAFAKAYARQYSATELEALLAFAETPVGRRYLSDVDTFAQDPGVIAATQLLGEGVQPAMEEWRRKRCAKKAEQRIAAGDTKAKCPLAQQSAAG